MASTATTPIAFTSPTTRVTAATNAGTYRDKRWLLAVARKVDARAQRYEVQLNGCRAELEKQRGWFNWF
jgi:hypothetical protein